MTKTAYKIDAKNCTVTAIQLGDDFEEINREIGCDTFTVAPSYEPGFPDLFVDDNGLWTETPYYFIYKASQQPLVGNAIAMDVDDEGNSIAPRISLEDFAKNVRFVHIHKLMGKIYMEPRIKEETV